MIQESLIFIDTNFGNQDEVFRFLSEEMVKQSKATDVQSVFDALKKREFEGTTGMMDGFAIPHAKSDSIIEPSVAVIKQSDTLEWDSLDGKPTHYIIAMFIPDSQAGTAHLTILSQVARMLMQEEFKQGFEKAQTSEELFHLISDKIKGE